MDTGDGARLEAAMRAEVGAMYPGLDLRAADMPKAGPEELNAPPGCFIVGYEDDAAVCCGGIKRLDPEACELKRMYVVPRARGRGVGRILLGALEDRARELGYTIARLDTGPKQPGSQHLYESAGYVAIPNFNANPMATFFGEKRL
ncbi:MAG: GNAT family N-acetyltransferase [Acidobacteriota bacterium]|nr:GNAT family N-acetyltransferase [Acidobacteriota bacterium]